MIEQAIADPLLPEPTSGTGVIVPFAEDVLARFYLDMRKIMSLYSGDNPQQTSGFAL